MKYSKPVWKMIREAMESLGGTASISQVIDWIDQHYPHDKVNPTTISTDLSDLSINGPPSSLYPMEKRFLYRVGRSAYRLITENRMKERKEIESPATLMNKDELFREHIVQEMVVRWLKNRGYVVVEKCVDNPADYEDITLCRTSTVFGIDIVAQKNREKWIIEVKGETKGGTAAGDVDLMSGIGQLLTYMKAENGELLYGIAIPNTPHFANALKKLRGSIAIKKLNLHLFLVEMDGAVNLIGPNKFYQTI